MPPSGCGPGSYYVSSSGVFNGRRARHLPRAPPFRSRCFARTFSSCLMKNVLSTQITYSEAGHSKYSAFEGASDSNCGTRELRGDASLLLLNICVASSVVFKVVYHEHPFVRPSLLENFGQTNFVRYVCYCAYHTNMKMIVCVSMTSPFSHSTV